MASIRLHVFRYYHFYKGIFNAIVNSDYSNGSLFSSNTSTVNYTFPIIFDGKIFNNIPLINVGKINNI
jgi:hypothetical protein